MKYKTLLQIAIHTNLASQPFCMVLPPDELAELESDPDFYRWVIGGRHATNPAFRFTVDAVAVDGALCRLLTDDDKAAFCYGMDAAPTIVDA